jgi:arginine decarboxylase
VYGTGAPVRQNVARILQPAGERHAREAGGAAHKVFAPGGGISSGMWQPPQAVTIVAGHGEGATELNAFDRALQDAGVADINFLRVTSIMPPHARIIDLPRYPTGLLLPAVYARIASSRPGDCVAAAIGIGICRERYGIIMEYASHSTAAEADATVRRMAEEGLRMRGMTMDEVVTGVAEHTVERAGCAVAVALFWPAPTGLPR